jgi:hypothetical protein
VSLPVLHAADVEAIARTIEITHHETGARSPWEPNAEQRRYWEECERHRYVYATKPRQIGLSTAANLSDLVFTGAADGARQVVRTAIVVDTWEKALERVRVCSDFAGQLGLEHHASQDRITFPHGSEIVAFTAAGSGVGRSLAVQRYHLTELPYWEQPGPAYGALMQSLSLGGQCTIETTMSTRDAFARELWRNKNEFAKVFFPVEMHTEYRADPSTITDEEWEWCRSEGFGRRDAAAWWVWVLNTKLGGDRLALMREYPQREEHMFQADSARFIRTTPKATDPSRVYTVAGVEGDSWKVGIWRGPEEGSGQYLIGVDTAAGKERDRSVVIVADKRDGRLCAVLVSDTIMADDLARVALELQNHYRRDDPVTGQQYRVACLIEDNGIGEATCQAGARLGLMYERITTSEESRYQGLTAARRAVESGLLYGPKELAEECDELHRDELGRFKGRKDLLMAYGFCARRLVVDGFRQQEAPDATRIRFKKRILLEQMRARTGLR